MNNLVKKFRQMAPVISMIISQVLLLGCKDEDSKEYIEGQIPETEVAAYIAQMNQDIADMQQLADGKLRVLTYFQEQDNVWVMELENGHILRIYPEVEKNEKKEIPILGINEEGYWIYEFYNTEDILTDVNGEPVAALAKTGKGTFVPRLRLNEKNYWEVSFNGMQWKQLTSRPVDVISTTSAAYSLMNGLVADEKNKTVGLSLCCGELTITSVVLGKGTTEAWNKFVLGTSDNVLLDFSYAGYHHGEVAPSDGFSLGYEVMNVKERMNAKNLTARAALIDILQEKNLTRKNGTNGNNPNARVVIYFPEGEYVLHNEDDNGMREPEAGKTYATDSKGNNTSYSIPITGGHLVIKGDGPDKTKLIMATPNLPGSTEVMYSSPCMLELKHNSDTRKMCTVTSDAKKGTYVVEVDDATGLNKGDWVCLYLKDNTPELVDKELSPYKAEATMTNIIDKGVQVQDFHQIIAKSGNRITFKEPIMHEVEARWKWEIHRYPHYEEVGVEDLSFVGQAKDDLKHHGTWEDDGAYKPLNMVRLTNSWMRRVKFTSVSEATSIINSANVSAYDITIEGNRGHSAIRSAGSSRVFIGKVADRTNGLLIDNRSVYEEGAGQYHACGVSKPSMGAVIWRVHWGKDACFESHATQPRATLIDACKGGFMQFRQGGDYDQLPNHLDDLTIWNMYSERSRTASGNSAPSGVFDWWRIGFKGWKFLPPTIVGFHGDPLNFVQEQVKLDESHGTPVEPESLYEAQLERRLGFVPDWLKALK